MLYRGEQTIRSSPFPGIGTVRMRVTHLNGHGLRSFTQYRLPIDIVGLFGWEVLMPPEESEEFRGWWFTVDEARALFMDAANRAGGNIPYARQILDAMDYMLSPFVYVPSTYRYSVERGVDVYDRYGALMKGIDLLTLSGPDGSVWTYQRMDDASGGNSGGPAVNLQTWELGKSDALK